MAITAIVGVTDRTEWVKVNTCALTGELNGHWALHCQIEDNERGYRPTKGQQITIDEDGTARFVGRIKTVLERAPENGPLQYDIEAQDYNEVLYRRLVTATYSNRSLYEIVLDIVATALSGEGVTTTNVDAPSPVVAISETLRFDHVPVAQVFERLTELTGYLFYIDFTNDLHCSLFTVNPAPFTLTDTSDNWRDMEIRRSDENYVNRQHVRGAATVSSQKVDTIIAIDGQWQFPTTALIVEIISVTRDSGAGPVDETFIGGPKPSSFPAPWAAGYDWAYYNDMYAFELDRVDMGADIDAGDIVVITYNTGMPLIPGGAAVGPNIATANDYAEQTARAALEGGSGIHEAIEEQPDITDLPTLQTFADGRLRQRGSEVATIRVQVLLPGIMPGQELTITNTKHALSDVYLVTRVVYSWQFAADDDYFFVDVECTDGEPTSGGMGYLAALVQMARMGATAGISGLLAAPAGLIALTPPLLTDFSWINQGGATAVQIAGGIRLVGPATPGLDIHMLERLTLTPPYSVTACYRAFMPATAYPEMGMMLRESGTGQIVIFGMPRNIGPDSCGLLIGHYTSPTVFGAYLAFDTVLFGTYLEAQGGWRLWWARITDDGTAGPNARRFWYSEDGKNWIQLFSQSRTANITPDRIGVFVEAESAAEDIKMELIHWLEV